MSEPGGISQTTHSGQAEPAAASGRLIRVAVGGFLISILLAIVSARCLYADGSNFFLHVLERESFMVFANARCFAEELMEFPLVVAIRLGVTNLEGLRWAFGLGCFLPWPVAMLFCHRLAPRHFWVAALGCAAGYLNTSFMAVGEGNIAQAFFWPALFALVFARPLTPLAAGILIMAAAIMLFCYESLLFLGPVLGALAVRRLFKREEGGWQRGIFLMVTILFLVAAYVALESLRHPDSANFGGFKRGALGELSHPSWTVGWSAVWAGLLVLAWMSSRVRALVQHRVGELILTAAVLLWGAWPVLAPANLDPARQFTARFLELAVPLGLLPVVLMLAWRPTWIEPRRTALGTLTAFFLLGQSLWQITATWQWLGYVNLMRQELASRSGLVALGDTRLAGHALGRQALRFDWYWANPSLSIALSTDGKVRSLLLPYAMGLMPSWMPLDVFDPDSLPKLGQYGVDYREFISGLPASLEKWPRNAPDTSKK